MNRRIVVTAAAAAVVSGLLIVLLPQHTASLVRVAAATVAVLTAALVLTAVGPVVARDPQPTALDHVPTAGARPLDPHGLRDARRDLDRPTAPGSVPPAVRARLVEVLRSRGVRDADLPVELTRTPPAGSGRDPAGVARIVHRVLDSVSEGATHGHH